MKKIILLIAFLCLPVMAEVNGVKNLDVANDNIVAPELGKHPLITSLVEATGTATFEHALVEAPITNNVAERAVEFNVAPLAPQFGSQPFFASKAFTLTVAPELGKHPLLVLNFPPGWLVVNGPFVGDKAVEAVTKDAAHAVSWLERGFFVLLGLVIVLPIAWYLHTKSKNELIKTIKEFSQVGKGIVP